MDGYLLIRHRVKDYSTWKPVYDNHLSKRIEAGLTERYLFRSIEDPNEVIILFEAKDLDRAKAFGASEDLRERMEEAGVIGKPDIYFLTDQSRIAVGASTSLFESSEMKEMLWREEVHVDRADKEVEIEFTYNAPQAKHVYLAGNFNNWDTISLPMKMNKRGQWKATVRLLPGKYEYRYFVDGAWAIDKKSCHEIVVDTVAPKCIIDVAPKMAA